MRVGGALASCAAAFAMIACQNTLTPSFDASEPWGDGRDGDDTISGTERPMRCWPVIDSDESSVVVATSMGALANGDRLLVWQVQGYTGGVGTAGPLVLTTAGVWEIVTVEATSKSGANLRATAETSGFVYRSGTVARAQACRMAQYRRLVVDTNGTFDSASWTGEVDGVIAFYAQRLQLDGSISAGRDGFRGGVSIYPPVTSSSQMGESVDTSTLGEAEPVTRASSGGGGACNNNGGGGGANGGAGGYGGAQGPDPDLRGRPGVAIAGAVSVLTMGGGGGAGCGENGGSPGHGGRGGGVILVFTSSLAGAGSFDASGQAGEPEDDDGAGGGGGGGTVLVVTRVSTFSGSVSARGGNGGTTTGGHGAGGGGGGGRIYVNGAPAAVLDTAAGVAGAPPGQLETDGAGGLALRDVVLP